MIRLIANHSIKLVKNTKEVYERRRIYRIWCNLEVQISDMLRHRVVFPPIRIQVLTSNLVREDTQVKDKMTTVILLTIRVFTQGIPTTIALCKVKSTSKVGLIHSICLSRINWTLPNKLNKTISIMTWSTRYKINSKIWMIIRECTLRRSFPWTRKWVSDL